MILFIYDVYHNIATMGIFVLHAGKIAFNKESLNSRGNLESTKEVNNLLLSRLKNHRN